MSESSSTTSRHCWSWRHCFATVKHKKNKPKKQKNFQSNLEKFPSNDHIQNKRGQKVDENFNILNDSDFSSNEYKHQLIPNDYTINNEISAIENVNHFIDNDPIEETVDEIDSKLINQKSLPTGRLSQLDAIEEDLNEENSDEIIQPVRICCDRELINDSNDLYSRLSDLIKMNHIIIQFNDHGYLLGEFTRQLGKLKPKIDDIKRASTEIPRDAELLEARYSTLLATIESLSLLLKVAQISSLRSFINRLLFFIEERMRQLNKVIQLSSSIYLRQQRQDLSDDDFLSFRSALSSYEHLLAISS